MLRACRVLSRPLRGPVALRNVSDFLPGLAMPVNTEFYPTNTNSLLIRNLPQSVTRITLEQAFKDINHVRFKLQPGCSLHFAVEHDATNAAQILHQKAQMNVSTGITHLFTLSNKTNILILTG
jgi:RNA recognition motif-containing protein